MNTAAVRPLHRWKSAASVLLLPARIGLGDDNADGVLIETFKPALALQVFQVAADGAFAGKFLELLLRDRAIRAQFLGPLPAHGPAFAFGKGLFEEGKSEKGFVVLIPSALS